MSVFPVYLNAFRVNAFPGIISEESMKTISDMESFSVSIDNGIEEWTPMETEGWGKKLLTAKNLTISISGKRNTADEGNNYIAGLAWEAGNRAETVFEWTFPSGTKVTFPCIINVTTLGGDSTAVDALEFEVLSNGKPTVTND